MSLQCYVGIDPGLTGAIAVIDDQGACLGLLDMPLRKISGVKTAIVKNEVDARALADWLRPLIAGRDAVAVIERVGSRPGQGVATTFSLGDSLGAARAVLECLCSSVSDVKPQEWKLSMSVSDDKSTSLDAARRLFPTAAQMLKRKKDHGRAEALLISEFARKKC